MVYVIILLVNSEGGKEDKGSNYQSLASSGGCTGTVAMLLFHDDLDEENATWRTCNSGCGEWLTGHVRNVNLITTVGGTSNDSYCYSNI